MVSKELYYSQEPYPHAIMDGFAPFTYDRWCIQRVNRSMAEYMYAVDMNNTDAQNLKEFYPYRNDGDDADIYITRINEMKTQCPHIGHLFTELTSDDFIQKLEEMTGIKGLFADPYYAEEVYIK